jgi:hypothetical protein
MVLFYFAFAEQVLHESHTTGVFVMGALGK